MDEPRPRPRRARRPRSADPRDLSGGERQRLALEVVLAGGGPGAVVCLDEPTRGMDRSLKEALAVRLAQLADDGAAVLVATHDPEFAARWRSGWC